MVPGDRIFCAFVEPLRPKDVFNDWPLHATIIPWFRTDMDDRELVRELRDRLGRLSPFRAVMGGEAKFGRRRKSVTLVQTPTPLTTIEHEARDLLHELGAWIVDESIKQRRDYRPHITAQRSGRLHAGDSFDVRAIYIVEQKGDHKQVTSRIDI